MTSLLPWSRKHTEASGNGGTLTPARNLPSLMRRMQNEFDELFERFAQDLPMGRGLGGNGWRWGLDVEDRDNSMVVRAEAPGFEAGDFDIQVSENRLTLRACHKKEAKGKGSEYREERECYESMWLPEGIDKDKIDARYHSGVLTVTIPKTAAAKAKRISVKAS